MKRIITSIIVFFSIIIFCFFSNKYVIKTTETTLNLLKQATENVKTEDYENAVLKFDEAKDFWETNVKTLSTFLRHTELDLISHSFSKTRALLINENISFYHAENAQLVDMLYGMIEATEISLRNIF